MALQLTFEPTEIGYSIDNAGHRFGRHSLDGLRRQKYHRQQDLREFISTRHAALGRLDRFTLRDVRALVSTTQELLNHIAETLAIDPGRLHSASKMGDVEEWDSMGTMNLLLMLETEYALKLQPGQTNELRSVESIMGLLKKAGKLP